MNVAKWKTILTIMAVVAVVSCSNNAGLSAFTSDGCSLFPDSSLINEDDWCSCCYTHDIAYWQGGTAEERALADLQLKACVLEKTNNEPLAELMYQGVRLGGSPYFYNGYRWGYGWNYDRKYQALTAKESRSAEKLLQHYNGSNGANICKA